MGRRKNKIIEIDGGRQPCLDGHRDPSKTFRIVSEMVDHLDRRCGLKRASRSHPWPSEVVTHATGDAMSPPRRALGPQGWFCGHPGYGRARTCRRPLDGCPAWVDRVVEGRQV